MIRTNLSTRPFYNTQAVRAGLIAFGAVVALATVFNVASIIRYTQSDSVLGTQATQDADRAASLRAEAAKLRASVDARQVDSISAEARLANDLIDRRVFSWTDLLNQFEKTLPADVRITAVRPTVDREGRIQLSVNVVSRSVDDVNGFMESLEKTGSFAELLSREEHINESGQLEANLQSFYVPKGAAPPEAAAPAAGTPAATEVRR